MNRYEVQNNGDSTAWLIDMTDLLPVKTADGSHIYEAPLSAVQWTADTMNRTAAKGGESDVSETETPGQALVSTTYPKSEDGAGRNSYDVARGQRQRIAAAKEKREAAVRELHSVPSTSEPEPEPVPTHRRADRDLAQAWEIGSYKGAIRTMERVLQEALDSLPDTLETVVIRVKIESALGAVDAAHRTNAENPYV